MSTYCFVPGVHPYLSLAEIQSFAQVKRVDHFDQKYFLLTLEDEFSEVDFAKCGGFLKVGKKITSCKKEDLLIRLAESLEEVYEDRKLDYGISFYGVSEKQLRPLLLKLKKQLKQMEIKSRFVNKNFTNVTTAQYKSLKEKGIELIVSRYKGEYVVFRVIAVQDIDAYGKRDFEKPKRDMQMGMMPPKLAQILINLTGVKGKVWDPFCGGGTLVMEGLLMGRDMIGSDISPKHIQDAKVNVEWLKREWGIHQDSDLLVHDATLKIKSKILNAEPSVEAIAFEGYLGDPHGQRISWEELNKIIVQLSQLYVRFFDQIKQSGFKGPIVSALPYFILPGGKEITMDRLLQQLDRMGYLQSSFLSSKKGDLTCLKYSRKGQAVGRAIYRFELKK